MTPKQERHDRLEARLRRAEEWRIAEGKPPGPYQARCDMKGCIYTCTGQVFQTLVELTEGWHISADDDHPDGCPTHAADAARGETA